MTNGAGELTLNQPNPLTKDSKFGGGGIFIYWFIREKLLHAYVVLTSSACLFVFVQVSFNDTLLESLSFTRREHRKPPV